VRFRAEALAAFLARADRCAGVMFCAAVFPPCLPNSRAISVIAARTSGGILIISIVHLTGYVAVCAPWVSIFLDSFGGKLYSDGGSDVFDK